MIYFSDLGLLILKIMIYGSAMKYTLSLLLPQHSTKHLSNSIVEFRQLIYTIADKVWQSERYIEDWFVVRFTLPVCFFSICVIT